MKKRIVRGIFFILAWTIFLAWLFTDTAAQAVEIVAFVAIGGAAVYLISWLVAKAWEKIEVACARKNA